MKSIEQQQADARRHAEYVEQQVAETQRLYRLNREGNLIRKIRHLESHGMNSQAKSLRRELAEWRTALNDDPIPEQTFTPHIVAEAEAASVEIPEDT